MTEGNYFQRNKRYIALLLMIVALVIIFSLMSETFFSPGTL